MKKKLTPEMLEKIKKLRKDGLSAEIIALRTGVSKRTLQTIKRDTERALASKNAACNC